MSCTPDSAASVIPCPPNSIPVKPLIRESLLQILASVDAPLPSESETHTNSDHDSTRNFPVRPTANTQSPSSPASRARTPPSTRFLFLYTRLESSPVVPLPPLNRPLATDFLPGQLAASTHSLCLAPPPTLSSNISRAPHPCSDPFSSPVPHKSSAAIPPSFAHSRCCFHHPARALRPNRPSQRRTPARPLSLPFATIFSF